ncbi:response regulator [Fournierella massiliensis]|uniref:response regulator n=1 Tax=Allofournierella massiliensis TaxID=1650663 RepID=UPI0035219007
MEKSNREQVSKAVKNIVLVYADPIMLQTLTCLLNMNGYQVVNSFQTGRSALRYLKSGPQVDLVLLGCYLQDMDTVRFLHQMEQECLDRRLRVILTGPAHYIELVEQGHLSNCVDYYMIEPYDPKDLLLALNMFSPVRRLPQVTPLDKSIHRQLRVLGISDTMEGYWYLGGCLQEWLRLISCGQVPQMKSVLPDVARYHGVAVKAVESGIHRVLLQLKKEGKIPAPYQKMKPFLGWLADRVWSESLQEGLNDVYEQEPGTTTV